MWPFMSFMRRAACAAQDLLQHPDRIKWYESKFCADDMPDWNAGRCEHMPCEGGGYGDVGAAGLGVA